MYLVRNTSDAAYPPPTSAAQSDSTLQSGQMSNRKAVAKAQDQMDKPWASLAIKVGVVVMIGTGCFCIAYGLDLPQGFTERFIPHACLPHMQTIVISSFVVSGGMITIGIYQNREPNQKPAEPTKTPTKQTKVDNTTIKNLQTPPPKLNSQSSSSEGSDSPPPVDINVSLQQRAPNLSDDEVIALVEAHHQEISESTFRALMQGRVTTCLPQLKLETIYFLINNELLRHPSCNLIDPNPKFDFKKIITKKHREMVFNIFFDNETKRGGNIPKLELDRIYDLIVMDLFYHSDHFKHLSDQQFIDFDFEKIPQKLFESVRRAFGIKAQVIPQLKLDTIYYLINVGLLDKRHYAYVFNHADHIKHFDFSKITDLKGAEEVSKFLFDTTGDPSKASKYIPQLEWSAICYFLDNDILKDLELLKLIPNDRILCFDFIQHTVLRPVPVFSALFGGRPELATQLPRKQANKVRTLLTA